MVIVNLCFLVAFHIMIYWNIMKHLGIAKHNTAFNFVYWVVVPLEHYIVMAIPERKCIRVGRHFELIMLQRSSKQSLQFEYIFEFFFLII